MSRTSERNHEQSRCLSLASALHEDEDEDGAAGNANDDMQELLFEQSPSTLSTSEARAFFFSHALSTWNARSYEFAAILFTASAFPDSLAMSSIRGLVTTFAALLLSSAIGSAIDSSRSRLTPLLSSIVINRLSVLAACLAWYGLFCLPTEGSGQDSPVRLVFFAAALALGIVEKLSGIANMIASERDWLPAMADETGPYTLTSLNSVMRRIDLICKLVAPIIISWLISVTTLRIGIVFTGILSGLSCGAEVSNALRVWRSNARLRSDRGLSRDMSGPGALLSNTSRLLASARAQLRNVQYYFSVDVWIPSLTLALLYLSALSYAATLTTYLLNVGFSLMAITIARTCGSVIEVSSTFIAPVWIRQLAYTRHHRPHGDGVDEPLASSEGYDQKTEAPHSVGLQRSGLWGITLQWICLIPVVVALFQLEAMREEPDPPTVLDRIIRGLTPSLSWQLASVTLFAFLSISRMGLWVFDLSVQEITQTGVPASKRSSFAGTETAFVNLAELSQWTIALVLSRPQDFRWLGLGSLGAVTCSVAGYSCWVRGQRGHLLHLRQLHWKCFKGSSEL